VTDIILYIHILAASAWIGGSILLFGIGIYFRDKETQNVIYHHIGPFYGYFESIFLILLVLSGGYLFYANSLFQILLDPSQEIAQFLYIKIAMVVVIIVSTVIHMIISLKSHGRERTLKEKLISRATSMSIFLLNLGILWYAMLIRNIL
jgi:uncharacterized membrane protein